VSLLEEPDAGKPHVRFCEGPGPTDVWSKYYGTAGKPSGNKENKPRPVALEETSLLDSVDKKGGVMMTTNKTRFQFISWVGGVLLLISVLFLFTSKALADGRWVPKGPTGVYAESLSCSPTDPNIVLLGTNGGVYQTTDSGETWNYPGLRFRWVDVVTDASLYSNGLLASAWNELFNSLNNGSTWSILDKYSEGINSIVLIGDIRRLAEIARHNVAVTFNVGLTILYWQIGSRIRQDILKEKRAEYEKVIVATLSRQLAVDYGRGFPRQNLFNMIRFTEVFL
jgi:hypothetical protein